MIRRAVGRMESERGRQSELMGRRLRSEVRTVKVGRLESRGDAAII